MYSMTRLVMLRGNVSYLNRCHFFSHTAHVVNKISAALERTKCTHHRHIHPAGLIGVFTSK